MNPDREIMEIVAECIRESLPDAAVQRALSEIAPCAGRTIAVAVGKAAWRMACAAANALGEQLDSGFVITKYHHAEGEIPGMRIFEAGHPEMDENGIYATEEVLNAVGNLTAADRVSFLLSGGGSALFEKPLVPLAELQQINRQLLSCGANIVEINTIRKRLSAVKGGRFARFCAPAEVVSIVLSDVVGNHPDMIASGPTCPDSSSSHDALDVVQKYRLQLSPQALALLEAPPISALSNTAMHISGGVHQLCASAAAACARRGYEPIVLSDCLDCEAREAGNFLGSIARTHARDGQKRAFIVGGETIVHLKGHGRGGRNQEIALAAAAHIHKLENVRIFSFGSDGTDGPTDAAGGIATGKTMSMLHEKGISIHQALAENDAYTALKSCGGLIFTGATGTNVNDVSILLIEP